MITRKGKILIYVITLIGVFTWSILNLAIGIQGMNYLEQDIEHNQIVFNGIVYGVDLGSLSFCSRCVGCGVAGIIISIISCWTFTTWMTITRKEEAD